MALKYKYIMKGIANANLRSIEVYKYWTMHMKMPICCTVALVLNNNYYNNNTILLLIYFLQLYTRPHGNSAQ